MGIKGLIAIRSTVSPGTNDRMFRDYGMPVCSNPEFLREGVADYEFLNPPGVIIGERCKEHGDILEELYKPFRRPTFRVKPIVAEMVKLVVNGYLACQVSYWNQVKILADKLGVNSQEVGMLATFGDDRVSIYGARMHGKPFGGKCLPKDLEQLIKACGTVNVQDGFFKAIEFVNGIYQHKEGKS